MNDTTMFVHVIDVIEREVVKVDCGTEYLHFENENKALKAKLNGSYKTLARELSEYPIFEYCVDEISQKYVYVAINNEGVIHGIDVINKVITETHDKKDEIISRLEFELSKSIQRVEELEAKVNFPFINFILKLKSKLRIF